jgi:hypothetical protein
VNRYRLGAVVLATSVAVTALPATALAYGPSANAVKVIASGLNNPRGIIVGPHGSLLVAEAGKGGSGPCIKSPEGDEACFGLSGAVTAVWRAGSSWHKKQIVTKLPSLAEKDGSSALGPHDLAFSCGTLLGTIGLGGSPALRTSLGKDAKLMGHVVDYGHKKPVAVADLTGYEGKKNPDKGEVDSNPYGLLGTRDRTFATDAGGNDLLAIDKHGKVSTVAVFPDRTVKGPDGKPVPMQAVPTTVVKGPDGALYVGQLTGFPFPPGEAKVWRVKPGHKPTVYAEGFTNIIDIAFDRHGRLLVLEIAKNGLLSGDPTGALIRVSGKKRTEIAAGKLMFPGGVAVGRDALYVTNKSIAPGGGEVLRIPA